MTGRHFLFLGNQDLNGIMRGRSVPAERAEVALATGLPWVPANCLISAMNTLPPDSPFGPIGEIRFVPDPTTLMRLDGYSGGPAFDLALCDLRTSDDLPWPFCPRTALKDAVAALKDRTGLTMKVALEHEFTVYGLNQPNHVAFSLSAGRAVSSLADAVMAQLSRGGIALEQFQAEYGPGQFEISSVPCDPVTAADHTVLTLETIRDTARGMNLRASFLPKPALDQAGNGVHIHFSLWDGVSNITCERSWLANRSASFVAGLIDHAESLIPLTCLSANSYARLRPRSWVGAYTCVGLLNREAMIRLVPRMPDAAGKHPGASLEFRVADATANVYLALAGIIRAGLAGLEADKPAPPNIHFDPEHLTDSERAELGLRLLPQSIDDALTINASTDARDWLGAELSGAYYACRANDARHAKDFDFTTLAEALSKVY